MAGLRWSALYRYRASLQLFAAVNLGGVRSRPQIERPARRGAAANDRLRSSRYREIAAWASATLECRQRVDWSRSAELSSG